ncbi:receptor-type tyrosine-protein phosphatase H-like isoform X1 [Watersipora subatra]|uniref:receptor-type tyrosine-protein phosphatase H-like isoform X1 n=1 Tax=Watersipora subatra TaxID=2589382 RepID=UPI00355C93EA
MAPLPVIDITARVVDNNTVVMVEWISSATNHTWQRVEITPFPKDVESVSVVDDTSGLITGLTPGRTYNFVAIVWSGNSRSASTETSPLTLNPSDPTPFRASANGQNITLSWNYPAGHVTSGFSLQCNPSIDGCNNSIWKPVGSENSRNLSLVGAKFGQTYSFMLRAESGSAASKVYSDGTSVAINLDAASPSNLENIEENRDNVTLRWDAPLNAVQHSYRLYWNATNGAPSNYADTKDNTTTTLTVSTLEPGFSYDFSVASLSYSGALSSPSNVVSYTAYPSEVTGLTLKPPSHDALIFTWNFTGRYEDFTYSLVPDTSGSQAVLTNESDVYTLTYSSLSVDSEYNFTVGTQVQDAANASRYKFSEFITASGRTDEFNPSKVVDLNKVDSTNDSITIGWNPPDQPKGVIIGYVVQRYMEDENDCAQSVFLNCTNCQRREYDYNTTVINLASQCSQQDPDWSYNSTDVFSYEFTDLKVFTEYIFKVFAINTKVPSVDEISLTTNEAAPGPVRNLTIDPEARILYVKWLPPSKANGVIKEYSVEVFESDNEVEGANPVFSSNTTDTHLNVTKEIKPYTNYTISVRAKTGFVEWGPVTTSLPVTTLQSAPTAGPANFQNTSWESLSITLTWSEIPQKHRNGEIQGYMLRFNLSSGESIIKSLSKDSRTVTVSVDKANTDYVFKLTGYVVIDGQRIEGSTANFRVMSKPAAPPKQNIRPSLRDSWIREDDITKNQITFKLTNNISEIFSEANGKITHYQIIVAFIKENGPEYPDPDSQPKTWGEAKKTGEAYAIFDRKRWTLARRKRDVSSGYLTIGKDTNCDHGTKGYCNGPLEPNTEYCVLMRGWTAGGFNDSECLVEATTEPDVPMIVGIILAVLACLLIIAAVLFVLKRKGIIFAGKGEKLPSGDETPPRGQSGVQLEPVMPPPQAVDQQDFIAHTDEMHRDQDFRFSQEYQKLRDMSAKHTHNAAVLGSNTSKNRWVDILPFDHSRVKLLPADEEEGSDYINANYMPGYSSKREYIATQGPLPGTIDHFWRMIWEQNVSMVVMLTQCIERGRRKCEPYWPENMEEAAIYGDLVVTKRSESILPEYTIRIFDIQMATRKRPCIMFHFTHWPDFGCPETCDSLLKFITDIRMHFTKETGRCGPIVVHCSAGVGRTGTYIAVDRLLQHIQDHDEIDIFNLVLEMRNYRCRMVQTEDQYIYIHDCLKEALLTGMSSRYTPKASHEEDPIYQNTQAMDPEMVLIDVHGKSGEDGAVKNTEL